MPDVILFDLDGTLWNPRKREATFRGAIQRRWGITAQEYDTWSAEYTERLQDSTGFDPKAFITHLHAALHHAGKDIPEEELQDLFFDRTAYVAAVYPEVFPVLEHLSHQFSLGVYSQGNLEFQLLKLQLSGLYPFFATQLLFISENKTTDEYISVLPESVVVDDRASVTACLKLHPQVTPILLEREGQQTAQSSEKSRKPAVTRIMTLEALPEIVRSSAGHGKSSVLQA